MGDDDMSSTGGLVEIDDQGHVVRSASSADPAFPGALLTPYSLVVLAKLDRVVSTNSSVELADIFLGVIYHVRRLSDLQLLKTAYFDVGENRYAQISPEEPRVGPGRMGVRADSRLRTRTHYRNRYGRTPVEAGLQFFWRLVRSTYHRWAFPGSERALGSCHRGFGHR
jgi:hypothetical protein